MVNNSEDWKRSGERGIKDILTSVKSYTYHRNEVIQEEADELLKMLDDDEIDEVEMDEKARKLRRSMVETGRGLFDQASKAEKISPSELIRRLKGKEPFGYSKSDGGASHDAFYGMKAINRDMNRRLHYPLNLSGDDWEKERAKGHPEDLELVSAEGAVKYTTEIGGRKVSVVISERYFDPI